MPSFLQHDRLGQFLAGRAAGWETLGLSLNELRALCEAHDLWALLDWRLRATAHDWPAAVMREARAHACDAAAIEMLRGQETSRVLASLADANVKALLMKGTALAYSLYPAPSLRSRDDTDLLIDQGQTEQARRVLTALGYGATPQCTGALSQFEMQRRDAAGVVHAFDVHWRISTQPVFERVVTLEAAMPRSQPVAALGPFAAALGHEDALIVACIHPAMHHRNAVRALWLYDMHLLARALGEDGMIRFAQRARHTGVAEVCRHALARTGRAFGTPVPAQAERLLTEAAGTEPSAEYLQPGRRWHDDLLAGVRAADGFSARMRMAREILFPPSDYMMAMEETRGKRPVRWKLPVLYARRQAQGVWKVLVGKK